MGIVDGWLNVDPGGKNNNLFINFGVSPVLVGFMTFRGEHPHITRNMLAHPPGIRAEVRHNVDLVAEACLQQDLWHRRGATASGGVGEAAHGLRSLDSGLGLDHFSVKQNV